MDIQTKTKFSIGQEVFLCGKNKHFTEGEYKDYFIPMSKPLVVTQILVYVNSNSLNIGYHLFGDNSSYYHSEDHIFSSFEDAIAWCKEQNKLYE